MMVKLMIDDLKKKIIKRFPNNYHNCRHRPNCIQKFKTTTPKSTLIEWPKQSLSIFSHNFK